MHVLVGGLLGGVISGVLAAVLTVVLQRRRPRLAEVALAALGGFVAGSLAAATLGLGAGAATTLAGRSLGLAASGGAGAGVERTAHNVVHDRPVGEGVGEAVAFGAATGAIPLGGRVVDDVSAAVRARASHVAAAPAPAPPRRGLVHALDPDAPAGAPGRPAVEARSAATPGTGATAPHARPAATPDATAPRARPALPSVHAPPPGWLAARFDETVEAVRRGEGPAADPEDVRRFLHETYEHVNEVNALVRALGGRARDLPPTAAAGAELRGVHDFGERVSVRRVEELIEALRREPLRTRDGVPLEVPGWLARLPGEARRRGETTIDVGKLSPWVAAGLGRNGPPDPFAIRLHDLAPHHQRLRRAGPALIEEIADRVNAMRQVRIYRPTPMPVAEIRRILKEDVAAGRLPPEADELIDRALEAQLRLERSGAVNPYHLLEEGLPVGPGR